MKNDLPPSQPRTFYSRLESARGIAAVVVVLHHCFSLLCIMRLDLPIQEQTGLWGYATRLIAAFLNGQGAVLFFFVLSGFVLGESLKREKDTLSAKSYAGYLIKRVLRLYPAHLAVFLLWIPAILLLKKLSPTPLLADQTLPIAYKNVFALFVDGGNWPAISGLISNALMASWSVNPVTWSLSVEIFANLLIPAMVIFAYSPGIFQRLLILAALAWLMCAQMYTNYYLTYLSAFYAGTLIGAFGKRAVQYFSETIGSRRVLMLAIMGLILPMLLTENRPAIVLICEGISSWAIVAIIAFAPQMKALSFLDHSIIRKLGQLSYSLYLCHFLIMIMVLRAVHAWWGAFPSHKIQLFTVVPFMAVCLGISLLVSALLHQFVEVPGINLGKKLSKTFQKRKEVLGVAE